MSGAADKLKQFYQKVPVWKQLYYKWRSLKGIPFRKKFFIGYDLDANTYWEFYLDKKNPNIRPRRLVQPYQPESMLFNYFDKVPIQWAQWLKFARKSPPSIFDILNDEERIKKLQIMANFKDSEQLMNTQIKQQTIDSNLQKELSKLESAREEKAQNAAKILQRTGYDLNDSLSHKDIKHKSNDKLKPDHQPPSDNNDPWAAAQKSSDEPEKATVNPIRR